VPTTTFQVELRNDAGPFSDPRRAAKNETKVTSDSFDAVETNTPELKSPDASDGLTQPQTKKPGDDETP
jgi:hypothetical protein